MLQWATNLEASHSNICQMRNDVRTHLSDVNVHCLFTSQDVNSLIR
ncbi:hypothetical protein JI435_016010 [Parastagonospora nodorum SN15]|uniref:Uncharacterized protein n=1 Tax=Phaeosphaeria nodorum (strain SN15 / ATCC MYA-4574 / FGSC 10173) TaxID=321614 RepID=A0A7U2I1W2_PHANO|nr:hypothetical protein JI435_016010 [Parastagonospora nodorum SN15]